MAHDLYGHPFSSYTWKALISFYETGAPFEFLVMEVPANAAALTAVWPVGKFPVLVADGTPIIESSIIVEYVAPHLVPADRDAAREVRMLDRIFDNHVMNVATQVVLAAIRGGDVDAARAEAQPRSTRSMAGSTRGSPAGPGRRATTLRSPIARERRRYSTPTGSTRLRPRSRHCALTGNAFWPARLSPAASRMRVLTAIIFRSVRRIGTELKESEHV